MMARLMPMEIHVASEPAHDCSFKADVQELLVEAARLNHGCGREG